MKYEVVTSRGKSGPCSKKGRKFAKKMKSKSERLLGKEMTQKYLKKGGYLNSQSFVSPRLGWVW